MGQSALPCPGCAHLKSDGGYYRCDAMRLPDPQGDYQALPSRTGGGRDAAFRYGRDDTETRVLRFMSPGSVEGWRIEVFGPNAGRKVEMAYTLAPCPARYPRVGAGA